MNFNGDLPSFYGLIYWVVIEKNHPCVFDFLEREVAKPRTLD